MNCRTICLTYRYSITSGLVTAMRTVFLTFSYCHRWIDRLDGISHLGNTHQQIQPTYRLSLRIASFNSRSIRNSAFDVVDILNSLDILAVQEHWLSKQSLSFLNSVHSDFNARGITSIDYGDGLSGCPHVGLCFLWTRSLDPFIQLLIYVDEKRLLGLKITSSNATILLLNVYLPYQTYDNADEYLEILGKIQAISDSFESTNIFIIGDFNADIKNPSLFTPFLNAFINDCHLIASDTLLLPSDAFTYVSDAQGSRS